jgi:hypothetical protein
MRHIYCIQIQDILPFFFKNENSGITLGKCGTESNRGAYLAGSTVWAGSARPDLAPVSWSAAASATDLEAACSPQAPVVAAVAPAAADYSFHLLF